MSIYTIKKVPVNEVDKLESFIDNHWKKGHALVRSREGTCFSQVASLIRLSTSQ